MLLSASINPIIWFAVIPLQHRAGEEQLWLIKPSQSTNASYHYCCDISQLGQDENRPHNALLDITSWWSATITYGCLFISESHLSQIRTGNRWVLQKGLGHAVIRLPCASCHQYFHINMSSYYFKGCDCVCELRITRGAFRGTKRGDDGNGMHLLPLDF